MAVTRSDNAQGDLIGSGQRAVFLDKDGTLIVDVPYNVDPDQIRLTDGAIAGVRALHRAGYLLIVVSNQSGVARGLFPEAALGPVEVRLRELLEQAGVPLAGFYCCPHHPDGSVTAYAVACGCRKPASGLIELAAREHRLDVAASWMIGDILHDIEAGRRAGCRTILLDVGNETVWQVTPSRVPDAIAPNLQVAAQIVLNSDMKLDSDTDTDTDTARSHPRASGFGRPEPDLDWVR
jgi:D-glycero-D-manno-heptose 1,7-bisphosphate phosphatase